MGVCLVAIQLPLAREPSLYGGKDEAGGCAEDVKIQKNFPYPLDS